jgi:hypothetical protein
MALATGDEAPDFTHARTKTETNVTLSSLRGTQNVVLIFSPFTFTGASSARSATTCRSSRRLASRAPVSGRYATASPSSSAMSVRTRSSMRSMIGRTSSTVLPAGSVSSQSR